MVLGMAFRSKFINGWPGSPCQNIVRRIGPCGCILPVSHNSLKNETMKLFAGPRTSFSVDWLSPHLSQSQSLANAPLHFSPLPSASSLLRQFGVDVTLFNGLLRCAISNSSSYTLPSDLPSALLRSQSGIDHASTSFTAFGPSSPDIQYHILKVIHYFWRDCCRHSKRRSKLVKRVKCIWAKAYSRDTWKVGDEEQPPICTTEVVQLYHQLRPGFSSPRHEPSRHDNLVAYSAISVDALENMMIPVLQIRLEERIGRVSR
ncbi:predicted protein [Plenodomus lingam JN3]|uniref:Predicted protein n=1 Tax=Leptosphaeria maculans (strain JN3 / isolate v23.1.3 / race Av1-4-5-6-7-8) TaxID=985895 RepID=E5R5B0_LEPMJ|nr:predicted protein [Plenodomus lingam JN3]CBX92080.1 predicted protein [Plenodomus lingam JN3]